MCRRSAARPSGPICAAYDALDDETRRRIADLSAFHSLYYSQARLGVDPTDTAAANARLVGRATVEMPMVLEAPLRPLVKVHAVTGRPALYIGRHAYGIPGLEPQESTRLLDELIEFARASRQGCSATAGNPATWWYGTTGAYCTVPDRTMRPRPDSWFTPAPPATYATEQAEMVAGPADLTTRFACPSGSSPAEPGSY